MAPKSSWLRRWAYFNVVVHAVGLCFALAMRPGTGVFTVAERMAFLAKAPLVWTLGWGVWMICALALGGFFVLLRAEMEGELEGPLARAALSVAGVAIAVDLFCDAGQLAILPMAARGEPLLFLLVERWVGIGGALVANGLYALAALLVTLGLSRARDRLLGFAVAAAGVAMALAGILDSPRLVEISAGPTIILYCGWALSVAQSLG